jgi:hypothetical protein
LGGERTGEDVILSNLLAFDVRVFDPDAPLLADHSDYAGAQTPGNPLDDPLAAIQPSDPGWNAAVNAGITNFPPVGKGAYVDLCNARYATYSPALLTAVSSPFLPRFAAYVPQGTNTVLPMHPKSQLTHDWYTFIPQPPISNRIEFAYYDTWAQSYERDGINQDLDTDPFNTSAQLFDEGTDGLDTPEFNGANPPVYRNGVDDVNERETEPPYPYPLRGIEITIRMYEPGTRQVRQATVGADFIPD